MEPSSVAVTRERLHRLPKTELHCHLDGSLRPATLVELARAYGRDLPETDPDRLRDFMVVDDAQDLVDYLKRFDITLSVMQTSEAIDRIAYELAIDNAAENVRYLETRFSPVLNTRAGLTMHGAVEAALAGLRRAEAETGIRTAVIICALRHMSAETSLSLARVAADFRGIGVVAFDLAGPERGFPPSAHREAFRFAARANLGITVHAGEAFGAASIREAVHECRANRIGHGTRLYEDPALLAYVNDFRVPIEICLTSNVQTKVAETFDQHPLGRYFEHGLVVSLATDNRLMSGTTVTEEFWRAHESLGFDWPALCRIAEMGFEAAFLPHAAKLEMLQQVRTEIASLS
jgi:adenosine deaminase